MFQEAIDKKFSSVGGMMQNPNFKQTISRRQMDFGN